MLGSKRRTTRCWTLICSPSHLPNPYQYVPSCFPKSLLNHFHYLHQRSKSADEVRKDIATYLWDNYVQCVSDVSCVSDFDSILHLRLSNATRVILIGHGHGCQPVMHLLETRCKFSVRAHHATNCLVALSVMKTVKVVIQVTGHSKIPMVPKDADDLRVWYRKVLLLHVSRGIPRLTYILRQHSFVVIPSTHPVLGPETKAKDLRRHGTLSSIGIPFTFAVLIHHSPHRFFRHSSLFSCLFFPPLNVFLCQTNRNLFGSLFVPYLASKNL